MAKRGHQLLAQLVVVGFLLSAVHAKVINVGGDRGWVAPFDATWYPSVVYVGDVLNFTWPPPAISGAAHGVWTLPDQLSYSSCDFSHATALSNTSGFTYTLTSPAVYYFASNFGLDCLTGLKWTTTPVSSTASIAPTPAPAIASAPPPPITTVAPTALPPLELLPSPSVALSPNVIDVGVPGQGWVIPPLGSNESRHGWNLTASVGDVLNFTYNSVLQTSVGLHDVWRMPGPVAYRQCNFNAATLLGTNNLFVKLRTPGNFYFACRRPGITGGHCLAGQKVNVTVLAAGAVLSPAIAPTPTASPASTPPAMTPSSQPVMSMPPPSTMAGPPPPFTASSPPPPQSATPRLALSTTGCALVALASLLAVLAA